MNKRKFALLILSPLLLTLVVMAVIVGLAYVSDSDLAISLSDAMQSGTSESERVNDLVLRVLFLPLQLIFIGIVLAIALGVYRRRWNISRRIFGPLTAKQQQRDAERSAVTSAGLKNMHDDWEQLVTVPPERQLTLTHIGASIIGIVTIFIAAALILGQFVGLSDLAIFITALTSALAWGARLPVSDVLGGISNIFENNFNVGDRLSYRHFKLDAEGIVEQVNLRFTWLRASSGELITIPFGEIRTMRNFSRNTFAGVYVSFPIASDTLGPTIQKLEALAPMTPTLIPDLLEPWRVVCQNGRLGSSVELSLYGRAAVGREQQLQLAMHELVWQNLQALGIEQESEESA